MKTLNENDIKNVLEIQKLLSFDTYYTLLNGNTDDEQKYERAKREFVRKQSQLLVTDGAQFICGAHKGTFRTNYKWQTINDKGVARQSDVLPENFEFTDGFQILSIGSWQRIASTTTFNEEYPLLFRSTIQITGKMPGNNPPETYNLQFLNAGQNFSYEDTIDQAYEQSVLSEEEGNNKQEEAEPSADCTVRFSLDTSKDNNFGFDSYEVSKKGCKDKEKLKSAYKKLEPFREEYLMPWVSLAQYRYAILKVAVKGKFKEITFKEPKSYFTFEPATITPETQQVKITCNNTITEKEYKVEVLADGKVAGGLMFVENSIKKLKLPINWYNVVVNKDDKGKIKKIVEKQKIEDFCKRAFTPALIEVEINEITTEIDISNVISTFVNKAENKVQNSYLFGSLLCYAVPRTPYQISLFTTFLKKEKEAGDLINYNNGVTLHSTVIQKEDRNALNNFIDESVARSLSKSPNNIDHSYPQDEEFCMMFLANDPYKIQPSVEIPHELMHALGLEHTFEEKEHPNKEHIFRKGSTENYMDYDNTKETTFKWQWDILRKSPYVKLLILIFTLLFSSCKVMSDKELQTISCVCNDSITQEDKKLPIPPPERIKNDSIDSYTTGKGPYTKYTYYLKESTQKMVDYDLKGNIKQSYFSVPYEFIGREFIFDEQGNIKEVINHDEGWKICAFQALAIAKKRAGNNYYHKKVTDPLWQVRKTRLKGKRMWVVHYSNRKFKTISLYIDKDTGKIVKRVKH
ncbi:hypothetical protein HMPREF1977_0874 [Capnocytophaga ochracea F0287]|uniref:Uncharacterized protein n=1 Tax=Capnocytophaga ochracea F0287 TaxID=873517 RepID=E4MR64_CAPOC|nr:hypothetical protein [Capnocytophaga ochracea]EFS97962.1 hypothetical protein HMPREF1977_0874 [Capnocytophaga ochracea F0287]EJF45860.1 hypothetical protein HMPREF1319_1512 [Capnocytophaga ochracea str. Holt 25]UEB43873.1 peptidase [Capnocytophaga ochracea]